MLLATMTALHMEAITASLERSLQNCSLNSNGHQRRREDVAPGSASASSSASASATDDDAAAPGIGISSTSNHNTPVSVSDTTLELNSHLSLPYHWEQCLDLKTGEIYYINWRNGMKAKEDPRRGSKECESEEEEEEEEEESWYDSEESSSESCPSSSNKEHYEHQHQLQHQVVEKQNVLVVAGCKGCLMYFMVPKQVEDCPKCSGQLLHFDRFENASP